jgi:hypothetical protein
MMLLVGLESAIRSTSAESFYPIRSVVCVGLLIIRQTTASASTYLRRLKKQRAGMVTKEFFLPSGSSCVGQDSLSTPSINRTSVEVRSTRQRRLATTVLLGLAPVRSARASAATTGKASGLASMMTR